MRKWLNCELSKMEWEKARVFLKSNNIRYEVSGCGSGIHVEVFANDNEESSYLQLLQRNGNAVQTLLHLGHVKADNSYRINNAIKGGWDKECIIITDREMQVNLYLPEGADMNDFNKFGFFSGNNLKNAPTSEWFQFIVFPLNNSSGYPVQIGFAAGGGTWHFYMRSKRNESWEGVSWQEFNVSFKE